MYSLSSYCYCIIPARTKAKIVPSLQDVVLIMFCVVINLRHEISVKKKDTSS